MKVFVVRSEKIICIKNQSKEYTESLQQIIKNIFLDFDANNTYLYSIVWTYYNIFFIRILLRGLTALTVLAWTRSTGKVRWTRKRSVCQVFWLLRPNLSHYIRNHLKIKGMDVAIDHNQSKTEKKNRLQIV